MIYVSLDDLKGSCAGRATAIGKDVYSIKLNEWIMNNNPGKDLGRGGVLVATTMHELGHILTHHAFGTMDHGADWKWMMETVLGQPGETRCHSYAHKPARIVRKVAYRCDCREHLVSLILHNRMQKGQIRTCFSCGGRLAL